MDIRERQSQIAEDVAVIKVQVAEIYRLLNGNGSPGLWSRVRDIELQMAKQVGLVAGASAIVSLVISLIGWKIKAWMGRT